MTSTKFAGKPVPDYTLAVFAADQRMWLPGSRRIQSVRPATDGRFSFRGLPPGDYRVAAVVDVEQGQWFDPAFLRQIGGTSIAVTLGRGEKKTQDLNVAKQVPKDDKQDQRNRPATGRTGPLVRRGSTP